MTDDVKSAQEALVGINNVTSAVVKMHDHGRRFNLKKTGRVFCCCFYINNNDLCLRLIRVPSLWFDRDVPSGTP